MQAQRREEKCALHEQVNPAGTRQSNGYPYSPLQSTTSTEGARTSAANFTALMPPSMWSRSPITAAERRSSDSSESSSSSKFRKHKSPHLPVAKNGSADSLEVGTGYRKLSPPHSYPSNLSPSHDRRCGSSLSEVSVSTTENEPDTAIPPPPLATAAAIISTNRTVNASDYTPFPEKPGKMEGTDRETTEFTSTSLPKLARLRFGYESRFVPRAAPHSPSEKADSAILADATPQSPFSATSSAAANASAGNTPNSAPFATPLLPPITDATLASTPVAAPPAVPADLAMTPPHYDRDHASTNENEASKLQSSSSEPCQRPLPPPPLYHGTAASIHGAEPMLRTAATPPIVPHRLHRNRADDVGDAEAHAPETGFIPMPEIPAEVPHKCPSQHQSAPTTMPAQTQAGNMRTRSARRPTQSVQTARARAQQRRRAVSSSPQPRRSPATPQPDFFPGAKRLDDDRVPLSTKLVLGAACVVGVALVGYLARSIYRYASVDLMGASTPVPASKFARERMPKAAVVTDKAAAKIAREIRDRIVSNMQSAVQTKELSAVVAKGSE
ncbi:hypothetical protein ABL78_4205 [Leptomonas seymouri]|uniref:Uncharacterized protein n=1 Tax=Leptomonas seymouri TaxID=5684 RepID=A0A0N1PC00_LEPSE|nr:hypothetical protein ABL78_4205 [Leptomonas seymouri]|eukprot:KPI86735.1 hypothetical protein ABL78_4205 [Leptomonas seymouri]